MSTTDPETSVYGRDVGRCQQQRVFDVVADVAGNREHKLVEALGERNAEAVLSKFDAEAVTVTVRKPKPIAGVLDYAGIRITRTRDDL